METIEKIRKGELALYHDGKVSELASALNIVWPNSTWNSDGHFDNSLKRGCKFYVKSEYSDTWCTNMYSQKPVISVSEFLKEYEEWIKSQVPEYEGKSIENISLGSAKIQSVQPIGPTTAPITQPGNMRSSEDIHVGGPNAVHKPDTISEIVEKLKSGKMALQNDKSSQDLFTATDFIHPDSQISSLGCYWYILNPPSTIWQGVSGIHKEIEEIKVSDFLERIEKETSVTKIGHQSGNDVPKIENWKQAYEQALELLKKSASKMGKTVKVELEDKYRYEIIIDLQPSKTAMQYVRAEIYSSTPPSSKDVPFDVFMNSLNRNKDRIAKAIEDILNEEQP